MRDYSDYWSIAHRSLIFWHLRSLFCEEQLHNNISCDLFYSTTCEIHSLFNSVIFFSRSLLWQINWKWIPWEISLLKFLFQENWFFRGEYMVIILQLVLIYKYVLSSSVTSDSMCIFMWSKRLKIDFWPETITRGL